MAVATALLGTQTFTTANGSKAVTATPTVGDLIILLVAHTGNTSSVSPTDTQSGTYTLVNSCQKATNADRMEIWVRNQLISSATSTTFTHNPGTTSGGGIAVFRVTGATLPGIVSIRQSAVQSNQASGTPTPVLGTAALTTSTVIGAVFNATNAATVTHRTGYTEAFDVGYATPTTGLEAIFRNGGETSTSLAWGGTSASAYCSIAVEILETAAKSEDEVTGAIATEAQSVAISSTVNETGAGTEGVLIVATVNVNEAVTGTDASELQIESTVGEGSPGLEGVDVDTGGPQPSARFNASDNDKLWSGTTPGSGSNPTDGTTVGCWDEEGGTQYAAETTNKPVWRSSGINGLGAVDFDGTNDCLVGPAIGYFIGTTAYTFFIAFRPEGPGSNGTLGHWTEVALVSDTGGYWGIMYTTAIGGDELHRIHGYHYDGDVRTLGAVVDLDTNYVVCFRYDGTDIHFSINGGAETSLSAGTLGGGGAGLLRFGMNWAADFFNGRIGEAVFYTENLTGTALSDAYQEIQDKWLAGDTPINEGETGLGSEAQAIQVEGAVAETGAGSEAQAVQVESAVNEAAPTTESVSIEQTVLLDAVNEAFTGIDTVVVEPNVAQAEVGLPAETVELVQMLSDVNEVFTGTSDISLLASLDIGEVALAGENVDIDEGTPTFDIGPVNEAFSGAESPSVEPSIAVDDAVAANETQSIAADLSAGESGAGVDQPAVTSGLSTDEAFPGTETTEVASTLTAVAETAPSTESLSLAASMLAEEITSPSESVSVEPSVSVGETVGPSESASLVITQAVGEAWSAGDSVSITMIEDGAVTLNENWVGAEAQSINASLSVEDTFTGTDVAIPVVTPVTSEPWVQTESVVISINPFANESGAGADGQSVTAEQQVSEGWSQVDQQALQASISVSDDIEFNGALSVGVAVSLGGPWTGQDQASLSAQQAVSEIFTQNETVSIDVQSTSVMRIMGSGYGAVVVNGTGEPAIIGA